MESRSKKRLFLVLKIAVAIGALAFVFYKIEFKEVLHLAATANFPLLLAATAIFTFSKLAAAFRLNRLFHVLPLPLTTRSNLELYLLGMFYNVFLPGGIGGDGYKVYILNKQFGTKSKRLIGALLSDRLSGMTAICMLIVAFFPFTELDWPIKWSAYALIPLGGLTLYLFLHFAYPYLRKVFLPIMLESLVVQGAQVAVMLCLLFALGEESHTSGYLFLFLISSVVSVVPISVGGAGTREITFLYGAQFLGLDNTVAVAISLMFYLIQVIVSLFGLYYVLVPPTLVSKTKNPDPTAAADEPG